MSFSNHLGTFDLSDGKLRIVSSEHFPDERSACRAIQPFLEGWRIQAHLTRKIEMLRFNFDRDRILCRWRFNPVPVALSKSFPVISRAENPQSHLQRFSRPRTYRMLTAAGSNIVLAKNHSRLWPISF